MQFLATLFTIITAVCAIEVAVLSALFGDLQSHSAEYVSYIAANPQVYPASLYAIAQKASTASDLNQFTSNFPTAEFSSFITGFPAYSRVSSEMAAAEAATTAGSSSSSSVASSTLATSAVAAATSSSNSTAAGSSSNSTGATSSNSTGASSSNTSSSSSSSSSSKSGAEKSAQLVLLPIVAVFSLFALAF